MTNSQQPNLGATMAGLGFAWFLLGAVVLIALWFAGAAVAAVVAPKDRTRTFYWLALLILGPVLGVAAAAVANPRDLTTQGAQRPLAHGRERFYCEKCGAQNDIRWGADDYECWRCSEHNSLEGLDPLERPEYMRLKAQKLQTQKPPPQKLQAQRRPVSAAATKPAVAEQKPPETEAPPPQVHVLPPLTKQNLQSQIDAKRADYDARRITLEELQMFLAAAEKALKNIPD